jgi:hypothetical protein
MDDIYGRSLMTLLWKNEREVVCVAMTNVIE